MLCSAFHKTIFCLLLVFCTGMSAELSAHITEYSIRIQTKKTIFDYFSSLFSFSPFSSGNKEIKKLKKERAQLMKQFAMLRAKLIQRDAARDQLANTLTVLLEQLQITLHGYDDRVDALVTTVQATNDSI